MNINDQFPTKYLKASDLAGQSVNVILSHVVHEQLGNEQKPILYFQGHQKGLVLNKTNGYNVANLYGPETDGWQGKPMMLVPTSVDFKGQSTPALRLHPPQQQPAFASGLPAQAPGQPVQQQPSPETVLGNAGVKVESIPAGGFTEANPPPLGSPATPQAKADIDDSEIPFAPEFR